MKQLFPVPANPPTARRGLRIAETVLLLIAALFYILHFTHLTADFPNYSPWMDWSKYTDEGWYGDAAIRYFQRGHWYVPGDFNPAVALPVWPVVEAVIFRFTGVSLVAARSVTVLVFGGILIASYLLLRRWQPSTNGSESATQLNLPFNLRASSDPRRSGNVIGDRQKTLAPVLAVVLLAVSPFCFVFTRIAILEPMLVFLTLLALHAASGAFKPHKTFPELAVPNGFVVLNLGLLLPAMILTKTTAVFLLPSILFLLWASAGYSFRLFLRIAIPVGLLATVLWSSYFFLVVRPHFLTDYRYLFSANAYTGITPATAIEVLRKTFLDGLWIGKLLYPLSVAAVLFALAQPPRLLRNPLVASLILWAVGYAAFLAYHNNLQPRYYLVPAVPLTLLVAVAADSALRRFRVTWHPTHSTPARPVLATLSALILAALVVLDAQQTLIFVLHPEYTLVRAATNVAQVIQQDPTHNRLILSISGSDLSLMTGLPSICDDFGTLELADRVKQYRPGWYAAWNQIDDDKMDALTTLYHPVRVAAFPAMDDPARNLLILYRLDPKTPTPRPRRRRQLIPRPLQTKLGQQPSVTQLEH